MVTQREADVRDKGNFWSRYRRKWSIADKPYDEIKAFGQNIVPPSQEIKYFVEQAREGQNLFRWRNGRYVFRSEEHAIAWAATYVQVECESLLREFVNPNKSFMVVLGECSRTVDRKIAFRLATQGLSGYTEFSIKFRKVGFNNFVCAE